MKFNFAGIEQRNNAKQAVYDGCNGVTIINQGNCAAWINSIHLAPSPLNIAPGDRFAGESVSIGGNEGEILSGKLDIAFDPAGTEPLVVIIQKYYLPDGRK